MMLVAAAIMEEASPALAGTMMVFDFLAISSNSKAWKGGRWLSWSLVASLEALSCVKKRPAGEHQPIKSGFHFKGVPR